MTERLASPAWLALLGFTMLGAAGAYVPYFALHLTKAGLAPATAGALLASMAVLQTVSSPVVGAIADRTGRPVPLILGLTAVAAAAVAAFAASASPWLLGASMVAIALCRPPATVLLDAEVVSTLEASGRPPETYGRVRLWGSLGFLVAANVGGSLAAAAPARALALSAGLLGLTALLAARLPDRRRPPRPDSASALARVLADPPTRTLLVGCMLHGVGLFVYDVFLSSLIVAKGLPVGLTGPAVAVAVTSEIVVMAFGRRVVARWPPAVLVGVGSLGAAARLALTARVTSAEGLLAAQLLHGVAFGLWWIALVEAVRRRMPPDVRAGSTALAVSAAYGVGPLGGAIGSALLADVGGVTTLFLVGAGASIAASATAFLAYQSEGRAPTGVPGL